MRSELTFEEYKREKGIETEDIEESYTGMLEDESVFHLRHPD